MAHINLVGFREFGNSGRLEDGSSRTIFVHPLLHRCFSGVACTSAAEKKYAQNQVKLIVPV